MKKGLKILLSAVCVALCLALAFGSAPVSRAAGMMRLIIDGKTYTKVYNDMGILDLTHWNYDFSTDTLKLKNFGSADSPQSEIMAYPYSGSMTIELTGDNYISVSRQMAIIIIGNVTFTGTGSLTIVCSDSYAIYSDYVVSIEESASLNINALAGITALKGFNVSTSGSVNIHTVGKSVYSNSDVKITSGTVNLSGTNGIYTSAGNVYVGGGTTSLEITATQKAFYILGEENYLEWSANGTVKAGSTSPGTAITEYSEQKYFKATFSGTPRLNPPRKIYWDETVIDDSGTTNPVGRWSAVENAVGYSVKLYYKNGSSYTHVNTFTVTDALSCNFGSYFTEYGHYYFTVAALGDSNYYGSYESSKSSTSYYFTGDVASRYFITLPESDYFTIIPESGSMFAYYGESYSFTVEVDPAYTQSELIVWANEARIALRKNKYTIDSVTENIVIKIGDLDINKYTVTLPEHEAYTIYLLPDNSTDVSYGESCSFSIELADIYMQSNLVVTANGNTITPRFGIIYTISNITEDFTVEITGLVRDSYDVTYKHLDGSVITTQTIDHGYTTSAPTAPSIGEDLSFVGWYYEDGTLFDFSTPINDALTLYARYEAPIEDGFYQIETLEQLIWFRDEVNFGNTGISAKLLADIEMNSGKYIVMNGEPVFTSDATVWEPIGGYDYEDEDNYVKFFAGSFDGGGHTLYGFYIEHDKMAAEASSLGIFGIVSSQGSVYNLNVAMSEFDGFGDIGSIAGVSYSPVYGCSSSAVLIGVEDVGGIVGEAHANVYDCEFSGRITVEQYTSSSSAAPIGGTNAGGIIGRAADNAASLKNCNVSGSVSAYQNAGGLVGISEIEMAIENCTNAAEITAQDNAAGLLAQASGLAISFTDCSNTGAVTSSLSAGGLFGEADATAVRCVNSGAVSGAGLAGGFGASGVLSVSECINEAEIVSSSGSAAGFIASGDINAEFCYNIGEVNAASAASGFAASGESAVIDQCHTYAVLSAEAVDAFAVSFTSCDVGLAFYCSDLHASVNGTAADAEEFYCGYVALRLNRENSNNFWHQAELYPIFSDEDKPGFVLPFGGDGSVSAPYIIMNENELRLMRILTNNETGWTVLNYKLGADIALSEPDKVNNFEPICSMTNVFSGSFDGDGYKISGVNISSDANNVAFFGGLDGTIKNLTLENFAVSGKINVAVIAPQSAGTVDGCRLVNCTVTGYENVGGAVGYNFGTVRCTETVGGTFTGTNNVAGIVGYNFGTVSYCVNRGDVSGTVCVGGVVGQHEGKLVESCFNYGTITGVDYNSIKSTEVGGVIGKSFSPVYYCGNVGAVSADSYAGGVVAANYDILFALYNGGQVTANECVGAIAAFDEIEVDSEDTNVSIHRERCYYLEGTALNGLVIGQAQTADQAYSGVTAYALNKYGVEKRFAQDGDHPTIAKPDGSDAVIYTVTFYSFDSFYYLAATKAGGTAVTPPEPTVDKYNFLYWDTPFDNVTANMYTTAIFDKDTEIIFMPYSDIQVDKTEYIKIICGIDPESGTTVSYIDSQIANSSPIVYTNYYEDTEYGLEDRLFTGMNVSLCPQTGVKADTYYVVIFGDVNGDGYVDEKDAFILNMICCEMIYIEELDEAQQVAADINRDGAVDELDFELIQQYLLKQETINQMPN